MRGYNEAGTRKFHFFPVVFPVGCMQRSAKKAAQSAAFSYCPA
jgi:hypothetical protein